MHRGREVFVAFAKRSPLLRNMLFKEKLLSVRWIEIPFVRLLVTLYPESSVGLLLQGFHGHSHVRVFGPRRCRSVGRSNWLSPLRKVVVQGD